MDPAKEMEAMIEELKNKQIPTVEKPVPLYTWWVENTIKDEMLWKKAATNQMHFVDDLNGLMQNKLKESERKQVQVISEHVSKSILLPVYLLQRGDLQIILRENFYNWKMSVICSRKIDANFDGLFHTTPPIEPDYTSNELADVYFEGFPKDLIFDYYEETDKKVWSAKLHNDQILWTTVYLILKAVGYVTPTEWTTKAKHQAELAERAAEREAKSA
jgi:hypothetical protein